MNTQRTTSQWLTELGMGIDKLVELSGLDEKVVQSIVAMRYTTSPNQRQRIATALGVSVDDIQWGHAIAVEHMYGHGPQFGRSP
jgi:hypothetical protein